MKISVTTQLGKTSYQFDIDERLDMEGLHKAAVLGNPPTYCHECKNSDPLKFKLDSNKDKEGNTYVNVVCMNAGCFAKAKLGQYKTGGYFFHKFEKYVKPEATQ